MSILNVVTTHYTDNKTGKFFKMYLNKFKLEIKMVINWNIHPWIHT